MLAIERQSRITQLLNERQAVSVAELAQTFGVSDMTIRRDLLRLEERGVLRRTHGGASILRRPPGDYPYYAREHEQVAEKAAIARVAAGLIQDGETIVLDAGTTTAMLARLLPPKRDLTVITNSIHVVNELMGKAGVTVIVTGGTLWEPTVSLVGPVAVSTLRRFTADRAFMATPAISLEAGVTNSNLYEAEVKSIMIEISRQRTLLVDHTKFGRTSYAVVAPLSAFHRLITDDGTPAETVQRLREAGLEVLVASAAGEAERAPARL
jgi:DeoR family fructose operon transcriptional repressor